MWMIPIRKTTTANVATRKKATANVATRKQRRMRQKKTTANVTTTKQRRMSPQRCRGECRHNYAMTFSGATKPQRMSLQNLSVDHTSDGQKIITVPISFGDQVGASPQYRTKTPAEILDPLFDLVALGCLSKKGCGLSLRSARPYHTIYTNSE